MRQVRVAAAQFAATDDVEENLAVCLEMIGEGAEAGAELLVLPEFCNHLSVYDSAEHCWEAAAAIDGRFVTACGERARECAMYVVLTVTLRRRDGVTVSNLLLDPSGGVVAESDKQMLMGNERAYLRAGRRAGAAAETPFGRIGMYSCMDGVTCEVPRALSLDGARLLTNSLNSFASDEASLHVPVRAAENQVFVVAANKVGSLVPAHRLEGISTALGVPPEALHGAGESQIVGPDGGVIAKAPRTGRCVVSAEIDLEDTERVRSANPPPVRRPSLYAPLASPAGKEPPEGFDECLAACLPAAAAAGAAAAAAAGEAVLAKGPVLVVAPELSRIPSTLPSGVIFVTTRRDGDAHLGLAVDAEGVKLTQPQLHDAARLPWARGAGSGVSTLDLPWGRLALAVGDDVRLPEVARLAAVEGASVLAVCHSPAVPADVSLMLAERAAENRICIVAASPPGRVQGCALISPPADSLWSPTRTKPFDGTINKPEVRLLADGEGYLLGTIHPRRATRREVSKGTNLVQGRSLAAASRLARLPAPS